MVLMKVNDERLCRSTQWVVSLNTALSPSSCVVIQEEKCNHTLGPLTPLNLLTHPLRCPDVAAVRISGKLVAWYPSERTTHPRPAFAPHTHRLGPLQKPAGLMIVVTNPGRRLSWTRSAMR